MLINKTTTETAINDLSKHLVTRIQELVLQHKEGLICSGELINEVALLSVGILSNVKDASCSMRLDICTQCDAKCAKEMAKDIARHNDWINKC